MVSGMLPVICRKRHWPSSSFVALLAIALSGGITSQVSAGPGPDVRSEQPTTAGGEPAAKAVRGSEGARTERGRDRYYEDQAERLPGRHDASDLETDRYYGLQAGRGRDERTDRETDRYYGEQADRERNEEADRETERYYREQRERMRQFYDDADREADQYYREQRERALERFGDTD